MKVVLFAILSFLMAAGAWAQGYTIGAGDVLAVEVVEDQSLNRQVLVLPNGTIDFPFAGSIRAAGASPEEVARRLTAGISSNFQAEPTVFVTVARLAPPAPQQLAPQTLQAPPSIDIYFLGEFARPGVQQLEPGTTMLQALAASGGFTRFAATKRIQLRRTDAVTGQVVGTTLNYKAIANGAAILNDVTLADGDVLIAPERRLFE